MARKTTYQKVREEDRRAKISIAQHLKKLIDIQKKLENNDEDLNVPALRLSAEISLNLLKKRLPDLKAIEHTGEVNQIHSVINAQPEQSVDEWQKQLTTSSGDHSQDHKPH